jgi:hypothetical protein
LLGVIGARVAGPARGARAAADAVHPLPGSVEGLSRLVQTVIVEIDRWTRTEGVGEVWLVHNRREGRMAAKPQAHRLLPLPDSYLRELSGADWPGRSLPQFRMDPDRLMSWLVQQRLFVVIYRALAEALASEHASRLAAMQAAERNIDERRDDLRQLYRLRRQETITRELLDVVSGYEAVSGRLSLTRIEVHISDENAGKSGQRDKRCMMEARPANQKPVAVTHEAGSVDEACAGAAKKLSNLLETHFGKLHDVKGTASIRDNEHR